MIHRNVCLARASTPYHCGSLAANNIAGLVGRDEKVSPTLSRAPETTLKHFEQLLTLSEEKREFDCEDIHFTALALKSVLLGINLLSKVIYDEGD
ncbi:hypothetical protein Misp06_00476 [Microbulbifer sp. NBRC 101763]|uniref:hypothetical protein n=1 Tax=Microbulbifer TaxID=48073 RepID=UPI000374D1E4|nr:hypothetical protein [Microbulbifer variabilis]